LVAGGFIGSLKVKLHAIIIVQRGIAFHEHKLSEMGYD
jgi:hypothetical protein